MNQVQTQDMTRITNVDNTMRNCRQQDKTWYGITPVCSIFVLSKGNNGHGIRIYIASRALQIRLRCY